MQWVETASEYLKNIKTYANTIDLYDEIGRASCRERVSDNV